MIDEEGTCASCSNAALIALVALLVNEQWYRGRVIPQGQGYPLERSGLFPSNYVEKRFVIAGL